VMPNLVGIAAELAEARSGGESVARLPIAFVQVDRMLSLMGEARIPRQGIL